MQVAFRINYTGLQNENSLVDAQRSHTDTEWKVGDYQLKRGTNENDGDVDFYCGDSRSFVRSRRVPEVPSARSLLPVFF